MMQSPEPDRRRHILEAAERLLRHYGPGKTTMAEIAREASISVGAVYLEFASKDAILEALSSLQHARVLDAMRAAAGCGERPWAERFRAVFDTRVRGLLAIADAGAHAADLVHCGRTAVQTAHARFRAEERAMLTELLRGASDAGEFAVRDPDVTATVLLDLYASFSPPWLYQRRRDEVAQMLDATHALVLAGLLRR